MRLRRKLALAGLGLVIPLALLAGLVLLVLARRGLLEQASTLLAAIGAGLGGLMVYLALTARHLGASPIRAIEQLRDGAELIATVNPGHRVGIRTGDELEALAAEINRLADQLQLARNGLEERVVLATRALRGEQGQLVAILDGLIDGILVVGAEQRITLANEAARRLLDRGGTLLGEGLFDVVRRDTIAPHLVAAEVTARGVAPSPVMLKIETIAGRVLDGVLTRLPEAGAGRGPFVLVLREAAPSDAPASAQARGGSAEPEARQYAGMGLRSGAGPHLPGPARPELYDFSLLDETQRRIAPAERDHTLGTMTYVVFDTETTGLHPDRGDRVISLAGVRVVGNEVRRREAFDVLVHPGRRVPPESVRFHGISDGELVGAPPLDAVLPAFLSFVGEAVLVGHEPWFDLGFLAPEALRLGLSPLRGRPVLDARLLSRCLYGPAESHSLEGIAFRLGVPVVGRHSALGDALTTAEVFVRLLVLLEKRGVSTLGDLLEATRRARTPAL